MRAMRIWTSAVCLSGSREAIRSPKGSQNARAGPVRQPRHVLVQPEQQRPAPPKGVIVGRPVRRAVAGGFRLCYASTLSLPTWARESCARPSFATMA